MVTETNNWSVLLAGWGSHLKVNSGKTEHYKFTGDTIIDAKSYKKAFCSKDSLKQNWALFGFAREDIETKKVWFRGLSSSDDGLIYDFDISVGSKISLYNPVIGYKGTCEVTAIDSIFFQSEYRKTYTLGVKDVWIEGVGSKRGFFCSGALNAGIFFDLLCFSDNHIAYTNPKYQTCYKTRFTPTIECTSFDKAVLNKPYYFKIPTTEIFSFDNINFLDSIPMSVGEPRLPTGLKLNHVTGEISGIPTQLGDFPMTIYLWNNGLVTDFLSAHLIVDSNSANIEHESESGFSISPNPTTGFLSINCSSNYNEFAILIYNSVGEMIISKTMSPNEKLDIRSLSSGVYVVRIMDKQKANILFLGKLINGK